MAKQFWGHHLWQTALVNLKFWTSGNNGTTRVKSTRLPKRFWRKPTLLTLQHVAQDFRRRRWPVAATAPTRAGAVVVNQGVHSFLQACAARCGE